MEMCKISAIAGYATSLQETWLLLIPKNSKTSQSFAQVAQEHNCCVCRCRLLGVIWSSWILFLSVYHLRVAPVLFEKTGGWFVCFGLCFLRQNQTSWKVATN